MTPEKIEEVLGFGPNVDDDPDKVTMSWGFKIGSERFGIWDYKGSRWSTFGDRTILRRLFEAYT